MKKKAMKWNLAVFVLISFFGQISCLKCFQGAINVTAAAANPGTAIDCPALSDVACAMSYDSSSKSASFMCSKLNCTVNGVYTHESACVNASATLKNCCCYTDGCSFAFLAELKNNPLSTSNIATTNLNMTTPKPPSIVETNSFNVRSIDLNVTTSKPPVIANVTNGVTTGSNISMSNMNATTPKPLLPANVLKCFQGSVNTTLPISLTPTSCLDPFAVSCRSQNDGVSQVAVFSCSNSSCSINGRSVSESVCINVSSTQRNCCCYGDGCNTLAFSMGSPSNSTTIPNLSTLLPPPVIWANVTNVVPNNTNVTSGTATPKLSLSPLKCFQGSFNTTPPSAMISTTCSNPLAATCRIQTNSLDKTTNFSCGDGNCTLNGITVNSPFCVNVSSSLTHCCCYGDGCNAAQFAVNSLNKNVESSTPPKTFTPGALKCLQGSQNTTLPSTIVPTLCTDPLAATCRTQIDQVNKFATYSCSTSNCTLNGFTLKDNVCVNVSSTQNNCCCYGDSCNSVSTSMNSPSNPSFNTNKPAATEKVASKDVAGGCDQNGFKTLATAADSSALTKGKFAGYLTYRSSCQQLCDKSYGLIKCVAYMYEPNNRGKCTIFQEPIESVTENPGSNVIVSTKC